MADKISAYLLTHNNERTVKNAIKSLSFADEVIVVDAYSTDNTVEIVKTFTDKVVQRAWSGLREQYQFAQGLCTHEWVVFIDGDESISDELAKELRETLALNAELPPARQVQGFFIDRRTFFLNRWIRHGGWVPDRELRFYRKTLGTWSGDVHPEVKLEGVVSRLKGIVQHVSLRSVSEQLDKMNHLSTSASDRLVKRNDRFVLSRMILNPVFRFIKEYLFKLGFLDGLPGVIIAVNNSFYVFNKYAKIWEHRRCDSEAVETARRNSP
jgi:glycosyltransferase involved in cell wall biosynthesis